MSIATFRHRSSGTDVHAPALFADTSATASTSSRGTSSPAFGSDLDLSMDDEEHSVSSPGSVDVATPPPLARASPAPAHHQLPSQQEISQRTPRAAMTGKPPARAPTGGFTDGDDFFGLGAGGSGLDDDGAWHFVQPESQDAPSPSAPDGAFREDDLMLGLGLGSAPAPSIDDDALLMSLLNADAMQEGPASASTSGPGAHSNSVFSGDLTSDGLDHLLGFAAGSSVASTSSSSTLPWASTATGLGLQQTMGPAIDVDLTPIKTEPIEGPSELDHAFFRGVVNPSAIFASEPASARVQSRPVPDQVVKQGSAPSAASSLRTLPEVSPAQESRATIVEDGDFSSDDEPELRSVTLEERHAASTSAVQTQRKPAPAMKPRQTSTSSSRSDSIPPAGSYRPIDVSALVSGDSEDLKALLALPAMFGGVKGKGGKKGGGLSSVVIEDDGERDEEDDWRPSPEEYKKLSSKEKRQLRNKLSARAFRNRRKNYVQELEGHIRDRDRLIDAVRRELGNARDEAEELRREVAMLKRAAAEPVAAALQRPSLAPDNGLAAVFGVTPPSSGSTAQAASQAIRQRLAQQQQAASSSLSTFDPHKDASPSSLLAGSLSPKSIRKFWANDPSAGFGASRYTSVQTALMPDLTLPPAETAAAGRPGLPAFPRTNINPAFNGSSSSSSAASPASSSDSSASRRSSATSLPSTASTDAFQPDLSQPFEAWTGANDFNLRSLDAYRMQLWSRMARDTALARSGVPAELRPKFLRAPSVAAKNRAADTTNASLACKNEPSPSPENVTAAAMAQVVQQAITTRLFSAFVDAFRQPAGSSTGAGAIDAEKVAAVFTGRAKLNVTPTTPVKPEKPARSRSTSNVLPASAIIDADAALAAGFANLRVATQNLGMALSPAGDNNVKASLQKDRPSHAVDASRQRSLGNMFGLAK